jgi:hypothetical protein
MCVGVVWEDKTFNFCMWQLKCEDLKWQIWKKNICLLFFSYKCHMQLLQCLIALNKLYKNLNCKRHYVASSQNGNHIKMWLISTCHLTNIQPMWHGHLWLGL